MNFCLRGFSLFPPQRSQKFTHTVEVLIYVSVILKSTMKVSDYGSHVTSSIVTTMVLNCSHASCVQTCQNYWVPTAQCCVSQLCLSASVQYINTYIRVGWEDLNISNCLSSSSV